MHIKRIFITLFSIVLVFGLFAAGQQEKGAAQTGAEGPVTITAYIQYAAVADKADQDDTYYMNYIEDKFNIEWDLTTFLNNVAREKMNIAFAADELPDVVLGAASSYIYEQAIKTGQALALEEYITAGTGWIQNPRWAKIKPIITHIDGHIYTLPSGVYNMLAENAGGRYYLNKKWIESVGMRVPETLDELTQTLLTMKKAMPEKTIVSGHWENFRVTDYFILAHGMKGSGGGGLGTKINIIDGQIVFTPLHPNFDDYLAYVNELWEAGVMDKEYFTHQMGQLQAKGKSEGFGLASDASYTTIFGNSEVIYDYVFAPPLISPYNPEKWWPKQTVLSIPNVLVPVDCRYPDKVFEVLDWMGTPEAVFLYDGQISAEMYKPELVPEGLTKENIVAQKAEDGDYYNRGITPEGMSAWEYMNTYLTNRTSGFPMVLDRDAKWWTNVFGARPILKENLNQYLAWSVDKTTVPYFQKSITNRDLKFTTEEREVLDTYLVELEEYIDENHAKFIMGIRPVSEYNDFVKELEKYQIGKIQEVYQTAYDRYTRN